MRVKVNILEADSAANLVQHAFGAHRKCRASNLWRLQRDDRLIMGASLLATAGRELVVEDRDFDFSAVSLNNVFHFSSPTLGEELEFSEPVDQLRIAIWIALESHLRCGFDESFATFFSRLH